MTISLYAATVPSYLQTLGAVSGFLAKGLAHCRENNIDPEDIVETRLYADMLPCRFQVQSVVHHSVGAIEGLRSGVFRPPVGLPNHDFAALQAIVADAREALAKLSPEEIDGREDADVIFEFRERRLPFTGAGFLLSFSLPNFYFHAATAYDILRHKGVPLAKRDYMGTLRLKA